MKRIIFIISFVLAGIMAIAQKQRVNYLTTFDDKFIHFGFTLGINTLDFDLVHYNPIGTNPGFQQSQWNSDQKQITGDDFIRADVAGLIPGFTVGIVSNMRLTNSLDLRFLPGLSFGERKLTYNIPVKDINFDYTPPLPYYYSIKTTFLDFPLLFKYKANRINNDRPYVIFGTAYRQDISRTGTEDLVRLTNGGFYAEFGIGWDHYFNFFRFSTELKFSLGLNNQLGAAPGQDQRQYYSQAIKNLKSNIFTLSFHFE